MAEQSAIDVHRFQIAAMVTKIALAGLPPHMNSDVPMAQWRRIAWAMLHPFQFGQAYGRVMLAHSIVDALGQWPVVEERKG